MIRNLFVIIVKLWLETYFKNNYKSCKESFRTHSASWSNLFGTWSFCCWSFTFNELTIFRNLLLLSEGCSLSHLFYVKNHSLVIVGETCCRFVKPLFSIVKNCPNVSTGNEFLYFNFSVRVYSGGGGGGSLIPFHPSPYLFPRLIHHRVKEKENEGRAIHDLKMI